MREALGIDSVGPGGFRLDGVWRPGSLLVLDDAAHDWRPTSLAELTPDDFAAILARAPGTLEFVLLGTGAVQGLPARSVREALRTAGLGLEFMATEAAARMHNVLSQQGRLFATALIAL